MNKLNPFQICEIKSFVNRVDTWYKWKPERRFLGMFLIRKAGYYWTFSYKGHEFQTVREIEKDGTRQCKGLYVYYRPHLKVFMSDGNVRTYFFDDLGEMNAFINQPILKGIRWVNAPQFKAN